MKRAGAVLGSAVFFVIAPFSLAGLIPLWITGWHLHAPFLGFPLIRAVGVVVVLIGLVPLIESFGRFALEGVGTPAPIVPTKHLIVTGFYRHVRNPMYIGVVTIILGQALIFGTVGLLYYAAIVWVGFHLFVLGYEEPTLLRTHGTEYDTFRANVPRWIPRVTAWRG